MGWFNYIGLIIVAIMMIPNGVYAAKCKSGFENYWKCRRVYFFEQIGRFGCFGLMVINIPFTWFGFWFDKAIWVYIGVNALLLLLYCLVWIFCFSNNSIFRAISLSVTPSVIFLFSGIMLRNIPLILAAAIFAPCHIAISYNNAKLANAEG